MRLHRLEIEAFGPFAEAQHVDLDALGGSGLFLLHGPTGSGKTSVLDAICFALYGRVPGARGSVARLRSDHAADTVAPRVHCEFSAGSRRLRVTRSPAWERPKKRGTGTTQQPAGTLVQELRDGEWVPLTARNDEAAHLLDDVLGMGIDQFTKLVLLPQGEFAAFLRAQAEERRAMLQRLFGTERFVQVEQWLVRYRQELGREVDTADREREQLLACAAQAAAALPQPPRIGPADAPAESPADLAGALQSARRVRDLWAVEQQHAIADHSRATEALADAERLAGRQAVHAQRSAERDRLAAGLARRAEERSRIDAATRALAVAPLLPLLTQARAAHDRARRALSRAEEALTSCGLSPADGTADPYGLLTTLRDQVGALGEACRDAIELDRLDADLDRERRALAESTAGLETCRAEAADLAAARDDLVGALGEARGRASRLAEAVAAVEHGEAVHAAAVELASLSARLPDAEAALRHAVDRHQDARERWQQLRERRLAGMAAELAVDLRPGSPCPVCGATGHPSPARPGPAPVGEAGERASRGALDAAEATRDAAARARESLLVELAAATGRCDGLLVDQARRRLDGARTALEEARNGTDEAIRIEAELATVEGRVEDLTTRSSTAEASLAAARERVASLDGRRAVLAARVEAARGDDPDPLTRRTRLETCALAVETLVAARDEHERSRHALGEAEDGATRAALTAGFATPDDAAGSLLDSTTVDGLRQGLAAHDEALARVNAWLDDPDHHAAALLPPPDLAATRATERAATRRREEAATAVALAEHTASELHRLTGALERQATCTATLRQRHQVVHDLARCVEGKGGDNRLQMRLSAFVLAARLEQVAAAASRRLEGMSGGRYLLEHTDDVARGGTRSGLGLRVLDTWTGRHRDTASLSGGESFYASLALALGLADVVQAEAGGTAIETLFVDEGFGSLDEETLDEVMAVLDGLRTGGRVVGLVSHLSELRQRVPAQLEVVKTRRGSILRPSAGAAV